MNLRIKKKKKKYAKVPQQTMIGRIVDLSLEDFEKELVKQKVNVGTMNNLILNLEAIYFELRMRKEGILHLIFKDNRPKDDPEIKRALDGLYAEMIKVEQKITFLKQKSKELIDVG